MSYGHDHYVTHALTPSSRALSPCDSALMGACDDTRAHATVARSGGGCSFTHCHCVVRATDDRRYRHARCVSKIYLAGNRNVAMRMIVLCYCSIARFSLAVQCASAAMLMRPPSHPSLTVYLPSVYGLSMSVDCLSTVCRLSQLSTTVLSCLRLSPAVISSQPLVNGIVPFASSRRWLPPLSRALTSSPSLTSLSRLRHRADACRF